MTALWVGLLLGCRWDAEPDDPVKDPDVLPDTVVVDSDSDPVVEETDLVEPGETAAPPPVPVLCQRVGDVRAVADLDQVVQTGSKTDKLNMVLRTPLERAPGAPVVIPFLRERLDWTTGATWSLVEVDLQLLFSAGYLPSFVSERDPNLGTRVPIRSSVLDVDSDFVNDSVLMSLDSTRGVGVLVESIINMSSAGIHADDIVLSRCPGGVSSNILYVNEIDNVPGVDVIGLYDQTSCYSDTYELPKMMMSSPYVIGGFRSGDVPDGIDLFNFDNTFTSTTSGRYFNVSDLNLDGYGDIIVSNYDDRIDIFLGSFSFGINSLDVPDISIVGIAGSSFGSSTFVTSDSTGDGVPDIYTWSDFGGRHGLGSLALLAGPFAVGMHNAAARTVSEWSAVDDSAGVVLSNAGWLESAGDMNGDLIDDILVHQITYKTWRTGILADTAADSSHTAHSGATPGDTDLALFPEFVYGMTLVIPGGVHGRRDVDEGALRVVRTAQPRPVGDVNGDGRADVFFRTTDGVPGDPVYGLLHGCDFTVP